MVPELGESQCSSRRSAGKYSKKPVHFSLCFYFAFSFTIGFCSTMLQSVTSTCICLIGFFSSKCMSILSVNCLVGEERVTLITDKSRQEPTRADKRHFIY